MLKLFNLSTSQGRANIAKLVFCGLGVGFGAYKYNQLRKLQNEMTPMATDNLPDSLKKRKKKKKKRSKSQEKVKTLARDSQGRRKLRRIQRKPKDN